MPTLLPLSTEPRDLLLDDSNDIVVTTDLQFSRGIIAIAQSCHIALLMFAGEWFLNLDAGVRYLQDLLGRKSKGALDAARLAFRDELSQVVGVTSVLQCDVSFDGPTRRMKIVWQVATAFGDTDTNITSVAVGAAA